MAFDFVESDQAEINVRNLTNEISALKNRLQELMDMKLALQSSHYAVATQWQEHINNLEKKLAELKKENVELHTTVAILDKKLNLTQNKVCK